MFKKAAINNQTVSALKNDKKTLNESVIVGRPGSKNK